MQFAKELSKNYFCIPKSTEMARGDKGSILDGFHGRLNDHIVIKQRNGKPVMCFYPKGKKVKWTENQKKHREVFKRATHYAAWVMSDPEKLAFYQQHEHDGINAYNLAIADYVHKPVIASIDLRKARGTDYYLIRVHATDDFIITGVDISTIDLSGKRAVFKAPRFRKTDVWLYRISSENLSTIHTIRALAYDYTGNHTMKEYVITPDEAMKRLPHS